ASVGAFAGLQTLNLSGSGMLLATGNSTIGSGVLLNTGGAIPSFLVAPGATLDVNGSSFNTTLGWHKDLDGTLRFNAQQFAGTAGWTSLQGGTVVLNGGTNTLPTSTSLVVNPGATLDLNGNAQTLLILTATNFMDIPGSAGNVTSATAANLAIAQSDTANRAYSGTISGAVSFTKSGTGGIILTNPNTFTGAFTVNGGSVYLKNLGTIEGASSIDVNFGRLGIENHGYYAVADRVPDNVDINLLGGSLYLSNNANAASVENVGRIVLKGGMNFVYTSLQGGSGVNINSVDLIAKSLVRTPGSDAVVDFNGANAAIGNAGRVQFQTPPTLTNNIIGAWAINQRNWASYVNGIGVNSLGAAGYQIYSSTSANMQTSVATDNVFLQNQNATLAGNRTINTLNMYASGASTPYTLNLGGFTLNSVAGGLMFGQNGDGSHYTVSNGNLTAGTAGVGGDLHVYKLGYTAGSATGRALTIGANVVDNGAGPVRLLLNNSDTPGSAYFANNTTTITSTGNTYTGGTVLNHGNVILSGAGNPTTGVILPAGASQATFYNPNVPDSGNQYATTVTVANASVFKVGQAVSGVGIPSGTTITAIDATDPANQLITLSKALTDPILGGSITANSTVTLNVANLTVGTQGQISPANRVILNGQSTFVLTGTNTLAGLTLNNQGWNEGGWNGSTLATTPTGGVVNVGTGLLTLTDTLVATSQNPATISTITG
ncbi:MAG: hypothetical protein EBU72_13645, partial [Betaproteobacteria bacterium]|nr:hypothetical protein [Betaproteobacteria bacterium]